MDLVCRDGVAAEMDGLMAVAAVEKEAYDGEIEEEAGLVLRAMRKAKANFDGGFSQNPIRMSGPPKPATLKPPNPMSGLWCPATASSSPTAKGVRDSQQAKKKVRAMDLNQAAGLGEV
ncbi:hypothetical protein LINGRAHAP2_LOCUS15294 [Linum grandiflorum]